MATSFGAELRDERERLGLSLNQAYQATRVRVEILNAFEEEDFETMPPRGYSRNMIASYARWLGLDPRAVLEDYEDTVSDYEASRTFDADPYSFYGSRGLSNDDPGNQNRRPKRYQRGFGLSGSSSPSYRRDYNTYGADEAMNASRYDANTTRRLQNTRAGNTGGNNGRSSRGSSIFSGSKPAFSDSGTGKMRVIIIVVAIVLVIIIGIIIGTVVRGKSANSAQTVAPTTSVANTTDTSTTTTGTQTQTGTTTTTTSLAAPFTISFTVAEGQSSDIVVNVNGMESYNGNAISGETQSFSVSTSVSMTISNPDAVTVYKDGVQIPMNLIDGIGHVDMSVVAA